MLKMSELAQRSGVSAGTIKHYLREGLLGSEDDVLRTSRNMAYYPEQFVDRVRLIKPGGGGVLARGGPESPGPPPSWKRTPPIRGCQAMRRRRPMPCRATCSSASSSWRC
jgi:hypothetical protein